MRESKTFRECTAELARRAVICGLVAALAWTPHVTATTIDASAGADTRALDLRIEDGEILLALDQALELGLERNLSLHVQRFDQEEAQLGIQRSLGIYDFGVNLQLNTFNETSPSASNLDGADVSKREGQNWNLTLSQLFATGGTGSFEFRNSRTESNSTFATLNPNFSSDLDLSFNQPLLRDRGRLATERNLRISRTSAGISRDTFELNVTQTIETVDDAYWSLVEARSQLEVAVESLDLARQLHEQNRIRVEVGTLAPLELIQSEAGIAIRDEEIIRARAAVGFAEDSIRRLLNLDRPELWDLPIRPVSDPAAAALRVDLPKAVSTAFEQRPELRSKRRTVEDLAADLGFFKNQIWPRLDLGITYGVNGVGGDVTERDFFTGQVLFEADGGYSDAIDQLLDIGFEGWSVGLTLDVPLQNRTAKANRAIAELAFERSQLELKELQLTVRSEVRDAARLLDTAFKARASAEVSRRLADRNLEAEQKRYDNGLSTSFQVLEIQEDLAGARSREVAAISGFRKAMVDYFRSIGTLIAETEVEIDYGE